MPTVSKGIKIGITGSIASGKSTALLCFKDHGFRVFSADEAVFQLYRDPNFINQLEAKFSMLVTEGKIDKKKLYAALKSQVFYDEFIQLVHQEVLFSMRAFLKANANKPCVCEVPLLYEVGWQQYFDEVWFIGVSDDISQQRARLRGMSDEMYQFLKQHQWYIDKKKSYADVFIENNESQADFYNKLTTLIKERSQ